MPSSVQDLTATLLTAIDSEGNVKDMSIVLNVVSVLEKTNITAEDLRITRLGKFINLIRRKVADADRQLSKRLKKLVKQWQLLLSRLSNGVTPTSSTSVGELSKSTTSSPLTFADGSSEGGCTLLTSSSSVKAISVEDNFVSSLSLTSSSSNSLEVKSSLEHNSSRPNSRSPPSRTPTPTPISNTSTSRAVQQSLVSPTRNRFKMMQKLSSLKRSSPNKSTDANDRNTPMSSNVHAPHLSNSLSASFSSHPSTTSETQTLQSHNLSSSESSSAINNIASTESIKQLWTTANLVSVSGEGHNSLPEGLACFNGSNVDHLDTNHSQNSRKRPRSHSPLELQQPIDPEPLNKRHKLHKSSSKGEDGELLHPKLVEYLVKLPLEKVQLNSSRHDVRESTKKLSDKVSFNDVDSRISPSGSRELRVSFSVSLLTRVPMARDMVSLERVHSIRETDINRTNSSLPCALNHTTQDQNLPLIQAKSNIHEQITSLNLADTSINANPSRLKKEFLKEDLTCHIPTNRCQAIPSGACPGIDGCVGLDGYWYDWTDHITNQGQAVTVFPYVYIDD